MTLTILLYSLEITEEIFETVVRKLEYLGYKKEGGPSNNYKGFKFYGGLSWWDNIWMTVARNGAKASYENYMTWQEILQLERGDLFIVDYEPLPIVTRVYPKTVENKPTPFMIPVTYI